MIRAGIEKNISDYILSESVLTETIDKDTKKYKVVLKATIDDVRLRNIVNDSSAVANVSEGEKSYMSFVFVSRRQSVVQAYDNKVFKRSDATNVLNAAACFFARS